MKCRRNMYDVVWGIHVVGGQGVVVVMNERVCVVILGTVCTELRFVSASYLYKEYCEYVTKKWRNNINYQYAVR